MIRANKFFDPANSEFEVLGFSEVFLDMDQHKVLGSRRLADQEAPRQLGSAGMQEVVLTEPIMLRRGLRDVLVKATAKRPIRAATLVHIVCGRLRSASARK